MKLPSKSPITLAFGATTDPYTPSSPHMGTDFAHTPDDRIYAPFSGIVTLKPNNGRDGNGIYMTHANGDFHGLLHSSQYLVASGQPVTEGQAIAIMGETGYAFGVHLHWCVKRNGNFIDPMSLITTKEDIVTPDGKEVTEAFLKFQGSEPTKDQYVFYTTQDKRVLYFDLIGVLYGRFQENTANQKLEAVKKIVNS